VRFSDLEGAAVGVWGAGREIRSFATQLARRLPAARIAAVAFDGTPDGPAQGLIADTGARAGSAAVLDGCDVVVRSPGVSIHRPEIERLYDRGVPVATPTGLWMAERRGEGVIGVTGTKGKSTTAALAWHLARAAGRPARLAGNIGAPALDLLDGEPGDPDVVELSSYHTADMETGPQVAVVTSLFREHVDWHLSEDSYRAEKLRLLALPGVRVRVLNGADAALASAPGQAPAALFAVASGWDADDEALRRGGLPVARLDELPLPGHHNALNLCAALTALEAFGLAPPALPAGLAGFVPLPHRLQTVGDAGGVLWVDDSISTTPESALAALASFPGREVVLIGGGQDRGQDLAALGQELARRAAAVIGVPSTGPRLVSAARAAGVPDRRAIEAADLRGAVARAASLARAGSVVLLSPAAPSYDHYRSFEQRGDTFAALVRAITGADGPP
jgi:UDP-N-acetylmuramoyl-L-alanine---L-glutamate ligase